MYTFASCLHTCVLVCICVAKLQLRLLLSWWQNRSCDYVFQARLATLIVSEVVAKSIVAADFCESWQAQEQLLIVGYCLLFMAAVPCWVCTFVAIYNILVLMPFLWLLLVLLVAVVALITLMLTPVAAGMPAYLFNWLSTHTYIYPNIWQSNSQSDRQPTLALNCKLSNCSLFF